MRILFFMAHPGHMRNFESTLRALAGRGHRVHVAFDRLKKNLPEQLKLVDELAASHPAISYDYAPRPRDPGWGLLARQLRTSIDYLRWQEPRYAEATKLRERISARTPRPVRVAAEAPLMRSAPGRELMRRSFRLMDRSIPRVEPIRDMIRDFEPDIVLVTPLLEIGSPQLEYLRAAKELGVRTGLCVASWDNLTTVGLIQEIPDLVTVWNDAQREEATDQHRVPADRVAVTGAPTYDHWFDWRPSTSRQEFHEQVGLDPKRQFLLYLGSSEFIAAYEAPFILRWVRQLRESSDPALRDVGILVRPHPTNPIRGEAGEEDELAREPDVTIWPPAGVNPTDRASRSAYFDSIYHSAAVVGVNTSALIESAIVGRAVLTLIAPDFQESQVGTLHFHHLVSVNGGLLNVASSFDEHKRQLAEALGSQGALEERNRDFLAGFVRPFGLDTPATPIMVEAIERACQAPSPEPERPPASAPLVRTVLRPAARRAVVNRERQKRLHADAQGSEPKADSAAAPAQLLSGRQELAERARTVWPELADSERRRARFRHAARTAVRRSLEQPSVSAAAKHAVPVLKATVDEIERASKAGKAATTDKGDRTQARIADVDAQKAALAKKKQKAAKEKAKAKSARAKALKEKAKKAAAAEAKKARPAEKPDRLASLRKKLAATAEGDGPVIAGPWLGDEPTELLRWIPFLRWALAQHPELKDRLVAASRGGVRAWYAGLASDYVDVFDCFALPYDFVRAQASTGFTNGAAPSEMTAFEAEFCDFLLQRQGLEGGQVLHPSLLTSAAGSPSRPDASVFEPLPRPTGTLSQALPERYVAVQLGFTAVFPASEENHRSLSDVLKALTRARDVVVLDGKPALELPAETSERVSWLDNPSGAPAQLEARTLAIAGAEAFVGTCAHLAYLPPLYGLPSLCFYSERSKVDSTALEIAGSVFAADEYGPFAALDIRDPQLGEFLARSFDVDVPAVAQGGSGFAG